MRPTIPIDVGRLFRLVDQNQLGVGLIGTLLLGVGFGHGTVGWRSVPESE